MQELINFLKLDYIFLVLNLVNIFTFIGFVYLLISNIKLKNKYKLFIKKLGKGKDIEEDLENYISNCIQKVGIVRYSAFKDTGSDLSFAVAMLDENNTGVVFNGIYSREMSNIYAKPVENGSSKYTLSSEEKEAIDKAINTNNLIKIWN